MNNLAPIVLFVYNRPWHTQQTVEALLANELANESDLIIFADGAKSDKDANAIQKVRKYIHSISGFKSVTINEKDHNQGLANSIIAGVTEVVNKFGQIIVLEDDMVTSPYFLRYMNDALEMYKDEDKVISIHAYMYPIKEELPKTFFLKGADCWGWATWKRSWDLFESDSQKLLKKFNKKQIKEFDFNNSYPFYKMLRDQVKGKVDSWAIRWYASAFLLDKLTLYPGKSLLKNIGNDGSGTHCEEQSRYQGSLEGQVKKLAKIEIKPDHTAYKCLNNYFLSIKQTLFSRISKKIKICIVRQNFSPGLLGIFINPFYFARKSLAQNIKKMSSKISGRILDVGCGTKPYKELFDYSEYIGLEIDSTENRKNENIDFFYDGKIFPFKDAEFDSIVVNQVLEHIFNPDEFLDEIKRVLRPGGKILLTVPFVWDEHAQPYDYARYSSYGVKFILEKHDFKVLQQVKSLNNFRLFFQLLNAYFFKKVNLHNKYFNFAIISILTSIINLSGICVSIFLPVNNDLYLDNIILAEKQSQEN